MRPPRLSTHDYSAPSAYFVTVVTYARRDLLGAAGSSDPAIRLTEAGEMVQRYWLKLPGRFAGSALDAFVVMPDHLHGIVLLNTTSDASCTSLPVVMHWLKTMTTTTYFKGVRERNWPAVGRHLWQPGYYDRVIRSESEFLSIREYVLRNPGALWERSGQASGRAVG